jgi:hypothetical protein
MAAAIAIALDGLIGDDEVKGQAPVERRSLSFLPVLVVGGELYAGYVFEKPGLPP